MLKNSGSVVIRQRSIPKRVIFIVGPTACGKTEIAAILAKKIDAEIISCDSMQVYKGMGILTQIPSPGLLREIKHYLISEISPQKEFSAAAFSEKANFYIKRILGRGNIPLVVGGTGLYAKSLIDGLFPSPGKDANLRNRLAKEKTSALYEKLKEVDKISAEKIHPNDKRRIIRALEVYYLTGMPISEHKKHTKGIGSSFDIKIIGLDLPKEILYKRIENRIDNMFKRGLVSEVRKLSRKSLSKTAKSALGFKEVLGYIEGSYSLDEAKELLKKNTRHFAKRQLTWFRGDKRIEWVDADRPREEVVDEILSSLG